MNLEGTGPNADERMLRVDFECRVPHGKALAPSLDLCIERITFTVMGRILKAGIAIDECQTDAHRADRQQDSGSDLPIAHGDDNDKSKGGCRDQGAHPGIGHEAGAAEDQEQDEIPRPVLSKGQIYRQHTEEQQVVHRAPQVRINKGAIRPPAADQELANAPAGRCHTAEKKEKK